MQTFITLDGIDEAIKNLGASNRDSLRYQFLELLRSYYHSENDIQEIKKLTTDTLVRQLWDIPENDIEALRAKRKNFSGLKSAINKSLKKLAKDGGNPEGIVIGRSNIFDVLCFDQGRGYVALPMPLQSILGNSRVLPRNSREIGICRS